MPVTLEAISRSYLYSTNRKNPNALWPITTRIIFMISISAAAVAAAATAVVVAIAPLLSFP